VGVLSGGGFTEHLLTQPIIMGVHVVHQLFFYFIFSARSSIYLKSLQVWIIILYNYIYMWQLDDFWQSLWNLKIQTNCLLLYNRKLYFHTSFLLNCASLEEIITMYNDLQISNIANQYTATIYNVRENINNKLTNYLPTQVYNMVRGCTVRLNMS
jgi:hypothetical protein